MIMRLYKYPRGESNPHSRRNWILNPARLPIPPQGLVVLLIIFCKANRTRSQRNPDNDRDASTNSATRAYLELDCKSILFFDIVKPYLDFIPLEFTDCYIKKYKLHFI